MCQFILLELATADWRSLIPKYKLSPLWLFRHESRMANNSGDWTQEQTRGPFFAGTDMTMQISQETARHHQLLKALEADLGALSETLATFNLFDVLRISTAEIRHSNVLAWLLQPKGSHGCGSAFLRAFLELAFASDIRDEPPVAIDVNALKLDGAGVLREWRNIDLCIQGPANQWLLLIENKIKSKESPSQLKKYLNDVLDQFHGCPVIPVLLTLGGDDPSDDGKEVGYIPMSYVQVLDVIEGEKNRYEDKMPADAKMFLAHYLQVLRRLTMNDQELVAKCKSIYTQHRQAIRLVNDYGKSFDFHDACISAIKSLMPCQLFEVRRDEVWFLPEDLRTVTRKQEKSGWKKLGHNHPIVLRFKFRELPGDLKLIMKVTEMDDSNQRKAMLKVLADANVSCNEKAKRTMLGTSVKQRLKIDVDGIPDLSDESIKGATIDIWHKFKTTYDRTINALGQFDWDCDNA